MSITLNKIYRDVNSILASNNVSTEKIFHTDTVNAINDAIQTHRSQYIEGGLGNEFVRHKTITDWSKDVQYPFLFSSSLDTPVYRSLPIDRTVRNSVFHKTINTIEDETQTFDVGDLAIKDNDVFECVESFDGVNTFDLVFETRNIRNFYPGSGLSYTQGDVVLDQTFDGFYRATQNYDDDGTTDIEATGAFEKLYWRLVGDGYQQARFIPFDSLHQIKLDSTMDSSFAFSIKDDLVYVGADKTMTVSYIDEWQRVTDLSVELDLPDTLIPLIKRSAVQYLASKINVELQMMSDEER